MRFKKKCEVFTLTVLAIAALAAFLLGGSSINPLRWVGKNSNKTVITKSESKPIIVTGADGKTYILQASKTETSTLNTSEEPKMTLWQKLMVLPKLWLLLMVLGIFFPPIAAIMGFINRNLFNKAKQIVGGVEEALHGLDEQPEAKKKVLDTLSKKYDGNTKMLVSKIKRKL